MLGSQVAWLATLSLAGSSLAASAADWQSRSIYQLVTDRFAKTDGSGGPCDSAARKYCGGTWRGIINKLDYIQGMGFDAVWISPVIDNIEGETAYGEAFHGYWPRNFNALNAHFGTANDLKDLATALHQRGMYFMVDVVVNHIAANNATPPSLDLSAYAPLNTAESYHQPFCFITDYTNQTMVEQCSIGDAKVPLVDINTENPTVVSFFNDWIKNLVATYSIDGIRIDTVKHVRKQFWPDFTKASGVYTLGEVLDEKYDYTGDYTNYMDAVFNYPEWFALKAAFANSSAPISVLGTSVNKTRQYFKGNGLRSTSSFSENHDNARLLAENKDKALVKNMITWTFGNDGVPCVYYGQEAGYDGAQDPFNREALWLGGYTTDNDYYKHIKKLNQARKLAIADKNAKFLETPHAVIATGPNSAALYKYPMLTLLTNTGSSSSSSSWTIPRAGYKPGTTLVNIAVDDCTAVKVNSDGSLPVTFAAGQPQVYLPAVSLTSSGLCGSKAQSPSGSVAAPLTGDVSSSSRTVAQLGVAALVAVVSWVALL